MSASDSSSKKLYRPYLSLPEILSILSHLAPSLNSSPENPARSAYVKLFRVKMEAEMGLRKEAWQTAPSLAEKLGFSGPVTGRIQSMSGQEAWELFNTDPSKLSPMQIQLAKTYGWKEGLMSPVEAKLFESEMGL
jgi:hypothetical protein